MQIQFVNNAGKGFADAVEVENGTTIGKFFRDRMGSQASPADYTIRVNGKKVVASTILSEGTHVEIVKPDGVAQGSSPAAPAAPAVPDGMVSGTSTLQPGDRVTVTQNKIEGGAR